jgi:hypothetical protein
MHKFTKNPLQRSSLLALVCVLALGFSSCCKKNADGSETCSVTLDGCQNSVTGYALFSNSMAQTTGADIVFQWSTDSFATVNHVGTTIKNGQGLILIPYTFDVTYTCGSIPSIQLRAFESTDHSDSFVSGNINGRFDGTSTGNAAYTTEASTDLTNAVIYLDGNGAQ